MCVCVMKFLSETYFDESDHGATHRAFVLFLRGTVTCDKKKARHAFTN